MRNEINSARIIMTSDLATLQNEFVLQRFCCVGFASASCDEVGALISEALEIISVLLQQSSILAKHLANTWNNGSASAEPSTLSNALDNSCETIEASFDAPYSRDDVTNRLAMGAPVWAARHPPRQNILKPRIF